MIVPSRQENLPQTATEAQACGCPVLAFDSTGLPDAVDHTVTGYLARAFDVDDLVHGLRWILEDDHRRNQLRINARERAERLWSHAVVVPQYQAIYKQAKDSNIGWRGEIRV
jgi:glycosyltransferase involved in cell wall biosynthesis